MSDKEIKGEMVEMVGVSVVNTAHEGYRRAGFVLHQGENTLPPVTAAVLEALEADSRLTVMVIASNPDCDPSRGLGDPTTSTTIAAEGAVSITADTIVIDGNHETTGDITITAETTGDTVATEGTQEPVTDSMVTEEAQEPVTDTTIAEVAKEPAPKATGKGKGK